MEGKILRFKDINARIIPYDTLIQEQYNLTDTETKLYGILWNYLSKDCALQLNISDRDLALLFKSNPNTINVGLSKLKKLGFIKWEKQTFRETGGSTRYFFWAYIDYKPVKTPTFENPKVLKDEKPVKTPTFENPKVAYNNNNIILSNIPILKNKEYTSDSLNNYKATFENPKGVDKTEKNNSNIKMSSIVKEIEPKKKRMLLEEEKKLFAVYNKFIKGNFNEYSNSVFEGVPRCLKLFKDIYQEKALEKFEKAINLLLSSSKWNWLIEKDPTISQPKRFFNQTFMENHLIIQLDNKVAEAEKEDFSKDPDVIRSYQKNAEYLKQLREKAK